MVVFGGGSGCQSFLTDGGPTTGGIFWSEKRAEARLRERKKFLRLEEKWHSKRGKKEPKPGITSAVPDPKEL